jgi:hypothetical protein
VGRGPTHLPRAKFSGLIIGFHSGGQLPVEVVQKARQREIDVGQPKVCARPHTADGSERDVLEVGSFVIQVAVSNRSGLNSSGSSQYMGCLEIAHALTNTAVPFGMS